MGFRIAIIFICFWRIVLTDMSSTNWARVRKSLVTRGGNLDGFDFQESSSDFVVGKDRELLHASIDLKWIFDCLVQKETWINILNALQEKIHRIHPDYDNECTYREQAEKIMSEIYDVNPAEFQLR